VPPRQIRTPRRLGRGHVPADVPFPETPSGIAAFLDWHARRLTAFGEPLPVPADDDDDVDWELCVLDLD